MPEVAIAEVVLRRHALFYNRECGFTDQRRSSLPTICLIEANLMLSLMVVIEILEIKTKSFFQRSQRRD